MNARNNIVSLNQVQKTSIADSELRSGAAQGPSDSASITRRMTAPAVELKRLFAKDFTRLLQSMFDSVDDALFDLAENAPSNQQQNVFFESMREVRFKRVEIERDFLDGVEQDFVSLFKTHTSRELSDTVSEAELASDTLSLMDDDVVEEMVAVDTMVAKYEKLLLSQLAALDARLAELASVDAPAVSAVSNSNPVSPKRLCDGFSSACRILTVDIKARIVLFKLFEKVVLGGLDALYKQANELLIRADILPDYRGTRAPARAKQGVVGGAGVAASADAAQANELGQLLSFVPQYVPQVGVAGMSSGVGASIPPSAGLDSLVNAIQLLSASQNPAIEQEALLQLLNTMQRQNYAAETGATNVVSFPTLAQPKDVLASLSNTLSEASGSAGYSIGQHERNIIGLVSMLFQFVLDDRVVSEPMKAAISRLQVPVIKVALQEPNFFNNSSHPARRLLNEMTQASVGWVESENYHKDPLYQAICGAVERINNEYVDDPQIFLDVMADLKSLVEADSKRAELRKKRLVDAEAGRDESDSARAHIQQLLDRRLNEQTPGFITQMINALWSNILFLAYLQNGEDSNEWQQALNTMDSLLWTVSPLRCRDDRGEILIRLPDLLKSIREGFQSVHYDKSASSRFFGELELLHMDIMQRPVPAQAQTATSDSVDSDLESAVDTDPSLTAPECDAPVTREQSVSAAGPENLADKSLSAGSTLAVGQWIEMREDDGKKRCRLVAILRNSGKRIFVNRTGAKSGEFTVEQIDELLESGSMVLLEDAQLFDKALSSIIDGLRSQRSEAVGA